MFGLFWFFQLLNIFFLYQIEIDWRNISEAIFKTIVNYEIAIK